MSRRRETPPKNKLDRLADLPERYKKREGASLQLSNDDVEVVVDVVEEEAKHEHSPITIDTVRSDTPFTVMSDKRFLYRIFAPLVEHRTHSLYDCPVHTPQE